MTTTTTNNQPSGTHFTTKQEARINRDKDTGWGYAIAHTLPIVSICYACSRRTITPLAYGLIGNFIIGIVVALAAPSFIEGEQGDKNLTLLGYLTTPLLVKAGINAARSEEKFGLLTAD